MARRIGEILIDRGDLTSQQLQEALRSQRIFGGSIGTHLLQHGFVNESTLTRALASMHGVSAVTSEQLEEIPREVLVLLSRDFTRRHRAVPFQLQNDRLHLALQNPSDALAVHEAEFLSGYDVVPYIAPASVLERALNQFYPATTGEREAVATRKDAGAADPVVAADAPQSQARRRHGDTPIDAAIDTAPNARPDAEPIVLHNTQPTSPPAIRSDRDRDERTMADEALVDIGRRLSKATGRDEIVDIGLDAVRIHFERAAAFVIRDDRAVLWKTRGLAQPPKSLVDVDITSDSVFAPALEQRGFKLVDIRSCAENRQLFHQLGGAAPREIGIVGVRLKGRPILAIYGDSVSGIDTGFAIEQLSQLGTMLGMALESSILKQKILRLSGAGGL